jgi:hypothetical protein
LHFPIQRQYAHTRVLMGRDRGPHVGRHYPRFETQLCYKTGSRQRQCRSSGRWTCFHSVM